jgi:hypothetical protein
MKNILFLSLFLLGNGLLSGALLNGPLLNGPLPSGALPGHSPAFINPTGTYILKGEIKNSKIISHYGELRARLLDSSTVALCFYLNKGYPGYESGSLVDTLPYEDNRAIYNPAGDSSCVIYFVFDPRSAAITKALTDPHSGCGFRPGIIIPAVFEKTSEDIPVIQDLSLHGSF